MKKINFLKLFFYLFYISLIIACGIMGFLIYKTYMLNH